MALMPLAFSTLVLVLERIFFTASAWVCEAAAVRLVVWVMLAKLALDCKGDAGAVLGDFFAAVFALGATAFAVLRGAFFAVAGVGGEELALSVVPSGRALTLAAVDCTAAVFALGRAVFFALGLRLGFAEPAIDCTDWVAAAGLLLPAATLLVLGVSTVVILSLVAMEKPSNFSEQEKTWGKARVYRHLQGHARINEFSCQDKQG